MLLQMARFHSYLWLNSIPLCVAVPVCMCIYHIFFIHLSMDTLLLYLCYCKAKKDCSEHGGVHICFQITVFVFSEKYPEVELLDHVGVLCVCVCMCVYFFG